MHTSFNRILKTTIAIALYSLYGLWYYTLYKFNVLYSICIYTTKFVVWSKRKLNNNCSYNNNNNNIICQATN